MSTAYDRYRDSRLADPGFRARYEKHRSEIDAIDSLLHEIDSRRAELGVAKADLARLVGRRPESVRRLLSGRVSNPTLTTVLEMTSVLGMEISLKRTKPTRALAAEVRQAVRELKEASA